MDLISSDDEDIFLGEKMTLKEVRKRLGLKAINRKTSFAEQNAVGISPAPCDLEADMIEGVTIIETHSTPNILTSCNSLADFGQPVQTTSQELINKDNVRPGDSSLMIEKMVSEICLSSGKGDEKASVFDKGSSDTGSSITTIENPSKCIGLAYSDDDQNLQKPKITPAKQMSKRFIQIPSKKFMFESPRTPAFNSNYTTPAKNVDIQEYSTPLSELKSRTPIFKTPSNIILQKKPSLVTKRNFNNVVSPVASYIKSTPTAPAINMVVPKRSLLGASSIPKPVRSIPKPSVVNKENMKLPSVAYKCAKEIKLIDTPGKSKLPHSLLAKQVVSPQATIMIRRKHEEEISSKKPLQQNNSVAELSLHQADVSMGIQKSATKLPQPKRIQK